MKDAPITLNKSEKDRQLEQSHSAILSATETVELLRQKRIKIDYSDRFLKGIKDYLG